MIFHWPDGLTAAAAPAVAAAAAAPAPVVGSDSGIAGSAMIAAAAAAVLGAPVIGTGTRGDVTASRSPVECSVTVPTTPVRRASMMG